MNAKKFLHLIFQNNVVLVEEKRIDDIRRSTFYKNNNGDIVGEWRYDASKKRPNRYILYVNS